MVIARKDIPEPGIPIGIEIIDNEKHALVGSGAENAQFPFKIGRFRFVLPLLQPVDDDGGAVAEQLFQGGNIGHKQYGVIALLVPQGSIL